MPVRHLAKFWGLRPLTIPHVGAHLAEELEPYETCGWGDEDVWWVEAQSHEADVLRSRVSGLSIHHVLNVLAWDEADVPLEFYRTDLLHALFPPFLLSQAVS